MRFIIICLSFVLSLSSLDFRAAAQTALSDCLPPAKQHVLVYDLADLLTEGEELSIQNELSSFKESTSNVIVVITHPDFCGYESSVFAIEAGDHMGVGIGDLDNGVVMAIKPRNESGQGQIFIAIGEGLEGAIPDILTGRIVDRMIPGFKSGDWMSGIKVGLSDLKQLAEGEISESEYIEKHGKGESLSLFQIILFALIFGMIPFFTIGANAMRIMKLNNIAFGAALAITLVEMKTRQNAYNNFSHGTGRYSHRGFSSGRLSGGSSGFGGFGGGGFGGGGAGGSF